MSPLRILIAMSTASMNLKIKNILQELGYNNVETTADGHECLRKARALNIDLAVIDYDLPLINGAAVSKILVQDSICDIVLVVSQLQKELINELEFSNDIVVLLKPINKVIFSNTIEIMAKSRNRVKRLKEQVQELKESIEARKVVEKAKGVLMKKYKITEEEAFKIIQKKSMDTRKTMRDTAEEILRQV